MDKRIMEPNQQFPFDSLVLTTPIFVHSGNYFIKYVMNQSPLYIQPPKCITKQGFLKGGKRTYCDLLFTNENDEFIQWLEDLETYSQKYIYDHRVQWFESDLEMHDIENSFTSPVKVYKSGKYYIVRTIVPTRLGKCTLKIFNEEEMDVPVEDIKDGTQVMTIWEVLGIKCSTRVFQIDIEIKQMMVVQPDNMFEKCILTKNTTVAAPSPVPSTTPSTDLQMFEEDTLPPSPMEVYEQPPTDTSLEEEEEVTHEIVPPLEAEEDGSEIGSEDAFFEELTEEPTNLDVQPSLSLPELEILDLKVQEDQPPMDMQLRSRTDVYHDIYEEAKQKAEEARDLAISAYLEAKRIKELYMIQEPLDIFSDFVPP